MKIIYYLSLVLYVVATITFVNGYGEPFPDGHPTWGERESHALINALRINPSGYVKSFFEPYKGSPIGNNVLVDYPAQIPVYLEHNLTQSAVYHSNDMATNNCFKHDDCGGGSFSDRIKRYQSPKCNAYLGENIAAGMFSGIAANTLLICEKGSTPCYPDGTNDGHRSNMMSSNYIAMGIGLVKGASNADYGWYWTQDFTSCTANTPPTFPVHGGSHTIIGTQVVYLTDFYDSVNKTNPKQSLIRFSNGEAYNLKREYSSDKGYLYTYRPTNTTECLGYVFEFTTDYGVYTYPQSGQFKTLTTATSACQPWINTPIGDSNVIDSSSLTLSPNFITLSFSMLIILIFGLFM